MPRCKCCGEWVVGSSTYDPEVCWRCGLRVHLERRVREVKLALKKVRGEVNASASP